MAKRIANLLFFGLAYGFVAAVLVLTVGNTANVFSGLLVDRFSFDHTISKSVWHDDQKRRVE